MGFLSHAHWIEEERGDRGCFYVISSTSVADETTNNHMQLAEQYFKYKKSSLDTSYKQKYIIINWQYQLQKKLQVTGCCE
jgi:hypothetical protein